MGESVESAKRPFLIRLVWVKRWEKKKRVSERVKCILDELKLRVGRVGRVVGMDDFLGGFAAWFGMQGREWWCVPCEEGKLMDE